MSELHSRALHAAISSSAAHQADVAAYLRLRATASDTVKEVLRGARFTGELGGSWARADFHLAHDGSSLSDLDLVLDTASIGQRLTLAHTVENALLDRGIPLSTSVHPTKSFVGMALSDQVHFNLLELINWRSSVSPHYGLAKAALMLGRMNGAETGLECGFRLGMWQEMRVKLGIDNELDPSIATARIDKVRVGRNTVGEWMEDPESALASLVLHFDGRARDTGQWIYGHAADKARANIADR